MKVEQLTPLLGPKDVDLLPVLRRLLASQKDPLPLAKILSRLGMRGEALEQAAKGLESEDREISIEAATWLGARGEEARAVVPSLRRALAKATGSRRTRIALTLWRINGSQGDDSRRLALAALDDLGRFVSRSDEDDFGEGLAEVHSRLLAVKDVRAALTRALEDRNPNVRLVAAGVMARVAPSHSGTVPALRRLLVRYPDWFERTADIVARLGPQARSLAPHLLPRLRTEDGESFFEAERVLRRIAPDLLAKAWSAKAAGAVPEDLGPLWADLAAADAFRADLAACRLAGAGPRAVALVRDRLRPPSGLPAERVARLIEGLDDDDFGTRERASAALAKTLETAGSALRKARASNPTAEARVRLDRLLDKADLCENPEQRRRMRIFRLLEEMACPEAKALLDRFARDGRYAGVVPAKPVGAGRSTAR